MMTLPERCPRCGRLTSWSPLRVWCGNCSFQMRAMSFETVEELIARWNMAILDGVGYVELVRENNAREESKKSIEMSSLMRGI